MDSYVSDLTLETRKKIITKKPRMFGNKVPPFVKKSFSYQTYHTQLAFTCSKLTIKTLEQPVKYFQKQE